MKKIIAILVGERMDRGFVQSGFEGLKAAQDDLGVAVDVVDHREFDAALLEARVRAAAQARPDAVIVHGSKAEAAVEAVASTAPDLPFLTTGGHLNLPNVWGYPVKHYQAAFLAGVLAAHSTRTGVVGHLSGVPIRAGKFGRAAFAQGVRAANPAVRLVTGFCGNQDDSELSKRWTLGEIGEGADVIFTMLNHGRAGAIDACRERGVSQIGNVRDWTREEPDVFIGSAIANHGRAVYRWIEDFLAGRLKPGQNVEAGLEDPQSVRLVIAARVPEAVKSVVGDFAGRVQSGAQQVDETYDGLEYRP